MVTLTLQLSEYGFEFHLKVMYSIIYPSGLVFVCLFCCTVLGNSIKQGDAVSWFSESMGMDWWIETAMRVRFITSGCIASLL